MQIPLERRNDLAIDAMYIVLVSIKRKVRAVQCTELSIDCRLQEPTNLTPYWSSITLHSDRGEEYVSRMQHAVPSKHSRYSRHNGNRIPVPCRLLSENEGTGEFEPRRFGSYLSE